MIELHAGFGSLKLVLFGIWLLCFCFWKNTPITSKEKVLVPGLSALCILTEAENKITSQNVFQVFGFLIGCPFDLSMNI